MECGLFSSFDPSMMGWSYGLKWFYLVVAAGMASSSFYSLLSGVEMVKKAVVEGVSKEMKQVFPLQEFKELGGLISGLFVTIMTINLLGLAPFSLSLSSHLVINLSLALPLWVAGMMVYSWYPINKLFSHLVPEGSPWVLWPFLVAVEVISQLIRPVTLSVRLMANIMAGHLILGLVSEFGAFLHVVAGIPVILVSTGFMLFETAVCVVQAYVFMSLMSLYWKESV